MSLDVDLKMPGPGTPQQQGSGIFIREHGAMREMTDEEWVSRYPDREPVRYIATIDDEAEGHVVWGGNITHNLNRMAMEAGIYDVVWRPDEHNITVAGQLIEPLLAGLAILEDDPERFKAFNPGNGWGTYDGLVDFVRDYLYACIRYRHATVDVSR